jgi:DNA-directed RNA polymerase specialized sigma24 family protein
MARHLAVSTDAVGVHLHRARKHLRGLLADSLGVTRGARGDGADGAEARP